MDKPNRVRLKLRGQVFSTLHQGESVPEAVGRLAEGALAAEMHANEHTSVRVHINLVERPPVTAFKEETRPLTAGEAVMTLEEFLNRVQAGQLADSDGYGFYATDTAVSRHRIRPSYVRARHEPQCGVFYGETRFAQPCDCGLGEGVVLDQERIDRRWTHVRWHQYKEITWPEGRD